MLHIIRSITNDCSFLETVFRDYLKHLVNTCSTPINIAYTPAIPDRPKEVIIQNSPSFEEAGNEDSAPKKLDIKILTPEFYSRFVHYAHTSEAFDRECLFTAEKNRTLWISSPELLPALLPKGMDKPPMKGEHAAEGKERGWFEEWRWLLMKRLRCPPPEPAYPVTPRSDTFDIDDIRTLPFSDLDRTVRSQRPRESAGRYRRIVSKIFLAQRLAFGFAEFIEFADLLIRGGLCYVGAWLVQVWISKSQAQDIIRTDWWRVLVASLGICSCHAYKFLKGYT